MWEKWENGNMKIVVTSENLEMIQGSLQNYI